MAARLPRRATADEVLAALAELVDLVSPNATAYEPLPAASERGVRENCPRLERTSTPGGSTSIRLANHPRLGFTGPGLRSAASSLLRVTSFTGACTGGAAVIQIFLLLGRCGDLRRRAGIARLRISSVIHARSRNLIFDALGSLPNPASWASATLLASATATAAATPKMDDFITKPPWFLLPPLPNATRL